MMTQIEELGDMEEQSATSPLVKKNQSQSN